MKIISPKLSLVLIALLSSCFLKAQNGANLFDDSFLHKIEFSGMDTTLIIDEINKGVYQKVNVKIDGTTVADIGIATKGDKSFLAAPNNKKPFKIKVNKFTKGQKYDGIKRFNLHNNVYDNSIMREKFSFDAAFALGVPSPRVGFAEVYINEAYWGIYTVVEAQDEIYRRVFGNNDGMTMESFGSSAQLNNLEYQGENKEDYKGQYIVDKGEEELIWPAFIKMLNVLKNTTDNVYIDSVEKYFDSHSYFKFNAVLDFNQNREPKNKNGIYYQDSVSKIWNTICWDQNVSFPENWSLVRPIPDFTNDFFMTKYKDYTEYSAIYNKAMCELRYNILNNQSVIAKIEENRKIIDDAIQRDPRIKFSFDEYELSLQKLIFFVEEQNNIVDLFLRENEISCETGAKLFTHLGEYNLHPNPAKNQIVITNIKENTSINIYALDGHLVKEIQTINGAINIEDLQPGFYLLNVRLAQKPLVFRFVKGW